MANILHIDTAVEKASICLAENNEVKGYGENDIQKEHSSWLHPAINRIFSDTGILASDIDAVAVTIGPGSYTGLRVGLAAAKGLCFSLGKSLIAINTLELMANNVKTDGATFTIPVIDARRMEVFTAVYDAGMTEIEQPSALILDGQSYNYYLDKGVVMFTGNAVGKLGKIISHSNARFNDQMPDARAMTGIAAGRFAKNEFREIAYLEPLYVKEFYQAQT